MRKQAAPLPAAVDVETGYRLKPQVPPAIDAHTRRSSDKKLRRLRCQRGIGVSGCRRIGVGLGEIGKFLAQMGAVAGEEGLLRNFGGLPKSGMGVSPVSAWNRKDGRDAHPTLSAPSEDFEKFLPLTDARSVREGRLRNLGGR